MKWLVMALHHAPAEMYLELTLKNVRDSPAAFPQRLSLEQRTMENYRRAL
jgi:hypothetical protein